MTSHGQVLRRMELAEMLSHQREMSEAEHPGKAATCKAEVRLQAQLRREAAGRKVRRVKKVAIQPGAEDLPIQELQPAYLVSASVGSHRLTCDRATRTCCLSRMWHGTTCEK